MPETSRRSHRLFSTIVMGLAVATPAAFASPKDRQAPPAGPAAALPLLGSDGVHLYVQEAYEAFPDVVDARIATRYAELVDAGMDCSRHLFDWIDLQPDANTLDVAFAVSAMQRRIAAGTGKQFVNITVIDSGGPEAIPRFIRDRLDAGVPWDDPSIVDPFKELLSELIPPMLDEGMYMIGFANEPAGYYEDDPAGAASFAGFIEAAVAHARTLSEELATTVVFAGTQDRAIPALMPLIDVATFNHYAYEVESEPACTILDTPLPFFRAVGPDSVGAVLDEMIATADGRLVCIQEFGQSTGWGDQPETLGPLASLDTQRQVMIAFTEALADRREHFRTVCLWTLNDHTRNGMQYVIDAVTAEGLPQCYAANIAEIFGPTGLVRSDATASRKPAFDAVRAAILPLKEGRDGPFDLTGDDAINFFDTIAYMRAFDADEPDADRVTPFDAVTAADIIAFLRGITPPSP